ncbi:MAG: NAD-dependent malic enzyme, partial [Solirubrobacteraceae bacterium]
MSVTPSAQYRLTIRVELAESHGALESLTAAIASTGGAVAAVDVVEVGSGALVRDIVVDAYGQEHWGQILQAINALEEVTVIDTSDRTFQLHVGGKIEQRNKHPLKTRDDLSMTYTPGVARVCLAIA